MIYNLSFKIDILKSHLLNKPFKEYNMASVLGVMLHVKRTPLLNTMDVEIWRYKTDC